MVHPERQFGSPWGPANPQALNRYSSVLNNPMRYTDPGGHTVYMDHETAAAFASLLKELATELRQKEQGTPGNTARIVAAIGRLGGGGVGQALAGLVNGLLGLGWEKIAMIWELADVIETVNEESPDGVAIAGGANSGYGYNLYVLNRTDGKYETIPFSYLAYMATVGAGHRFDIGVAFGDAIGNGHYGFEDDMDGINHVGFDGPCPDSASSC